MILKTINDLVKGETARVVKFSNEVAALRLLSIGVRQECEITLIRRSPFRDALYIKVDSTQCIAIRKEEAQSILLHPES